jgi:hypothetical protein
MWFVRFGLQLLRDLLLYGEGSLKTTIVQQFPDLKPSCWTLGEPEKTQMIVAQGTEEELRTFIEDLKTVGTGSTAPMKGVCAYKALAASVDAIAPTAWDVSLTCRFGLDKHDACTRAMRVIMTNVHKRDAKLCGSMGWLLEMFHKG